MKKFDPKEVEEEFKAWFLTFPVHYGDSWEYYVEHHLDYVDSIPPSYIYKTWKSGFEAATVISNIEILKLREELNLSLAYCPLWYDEQIRKTYGLSERLKYDDKN